MRTIGFVADTFLPAVLFDDSQLKYTYFKYIFSSDFTFLPFVPLHVNLLPIFI